MKMESGETINLDSVVEANGTSKATPVVTEKSTTPQGDSNAPQSPTTNNSKENSATMVKQKGDNEIDDGAQERMLKDDNKIAPNKDVSEVKFISENGDAKIDIETVKQSLSGMGKEELMKFANDPFWVRLRWALFIFFWFLWFAMLGGAIAIIVMAPKCSSPQPKQWWEESAIVQLDPSTDSPNKTLIGLESVLDELKEQDIKAISLISLLKENIPGHTIDFKDIQPQVGTLVDVETFIKAAKDKGQHVIMEFDPNHSSVEHPWFKQSVSKEDPYTSYYIWADPKPSSDGKRQPPNNWLSMDGGSAWEWNEQRGQYYYHQFKKSQPDLNHNNSAVMKEFEEIFAHWLNLGISGFRLANTQYLTEDPSLRSESPSNIPADADDYQSLFHVHTKDRPENAHVLTKWQEVVSNYTQGKGLFTLQDDIGADILAVFNEKKSLINLPQSSQFLVTADANIKASTLQKGVQQWLNISSWPSWDLNGKERTLRQRMPANIADSLTLMTLLLPGTPVLRLNDTSSAKEAFTTLSKARSGLTFLYGDIITKTVNESIFTYTRLKSGNPGYLVMYHSGDTPVTVDVSIMPKVSEEVSIFTHSPNYVQEGDLMTTKLPSKGVPISPKSTLVLTFVPKKE